MEFEWKVNCSQRLTHLITFRLAHYFGEAINHFHAEYHLFPVQVLSAELRMYILRDEKKKKTAKIRDDDVFL